MNLGNYHVFMQNCHFPENAINDILNHATTIFNEYKSDFDTLVSLYCEKGYTSSDIQEGVDSLAKCLDISSYSVWLIVLIEMALRMKPVYEKRGINENIYWDTFSDLCYKAKECKELYNVWGTFVPHWYKEFFTCDIIQLGRLQYENSEYPYDFSYTVGDITIEKGYPIKKLHIPSSGQPFDKTARLDSYRKAYEFFKSEHNGKSLVFTCGSWLLYPDYKDIFASGSNTASFIEEFDIIQKKDLKRFTNAWRVFGSEHTKDPSDLPEKTSMQRAFKNRLLNGELFGSGVGIFLFDGEKIIKNK